MKRKKESREFRPNTHKLDGLSDLCIKCVKDKRNFRERKANKSKINYAKFKDKIKDNFLKRKYGISLIQYDTMLRLQSDVCAICKEKCISGRSLNVDHCHKTQKVRGLLCNRCNQGLGLFRENEHFLLESVEYLRKNR